MSVVCEASGMLGQQYVESMVREVSEWCMRSAVCCVSGVGSMACMVSSDFKWLRLSRTTENGPNFNIEGNGQPPLKMKILKIRFFHVTKGPNIGFEPNFHDHTTSNG